MSPLTTSSKAERFAAVIDLDVPPVFLDGGDTSLRPAITLTTALRAAGRASAPAPLSAEARLAMRERLVAAAGAPAVAPRANSTASLLSPGLASRVAETAQRSQQKAKAAGRRIGRRATALVGSVVIITSVSGVGVAAARSLPGSPFYDLKRATESVQLWLASGAHAKGQRHLDFARTRLAEARALGADSPYAVSTLRSMNAETREGSSDLIDAYRSTGDNDPLAELVTFTRKQYADLAQFGNSASDQVQAQTVYSMTLLAGVAQQVESVAGTTCLTCIVNGTKPQPTTPTQGGRHSASPTASPTPSGSTPGSSPSTSVSPSQPGVKPSSILPTGIIPTRIPTQLPTLPPLLPKHNGTNGKGDGGGVLPTISPLPLLTALAGLLSGQ
jgi:hypothetical protein